MGAVVNEGVVIEQNSVVAAGSVVAPGEHIPAGQVRASAVNVRLKDIVRVSLIATLHAPLLVVGLCVDFFFRFFFLIIFYIFLLTTTLDAQLWSGTPAKFERELSADEVAALAKSADNHYILSRKHQQVRIFFSSYPIIYQCVCILTLVWASTGAAAV